MINQISQGGLAQQAIQAALKAQSKAADGISQQVREKLATPLADPGMTPKSEPFGSSLGAAVIEQVRAVDSGLVKSEALPLDMAAGRIADFHELAGQLKQSELAFKFALEVRNKLIEAYRETMRMTV